MFNCRSFQVGTAVLNICLVVGAVSSGQGQLTPGVIVPASLQVKIFFIW